MSFTRKASNVGLTPPVAGSAITIAPTATNAAVLRRRPLPDPENTTPRLVRRCFFLQGLSPPDLGCDSSRREASKGRHHAVSSGSREVLWACPAASPQETHASQRN